MLYSALRLGSLSPELTRSALRNSVIGFATAAAMFAGTSAYNPAHATEPNPLVAACQKIGNSTNRAACMVEAVEKDTAARQQNIERQRRVQEEAKAVIPCYDFLIAEVTAGRTTKEDVVKKAGGSLTDANVCSVAEGYGRRADLKPVTMQAKPISFTRQ